MKSKISLSLLCIAVLISGCRKDPVFNTDSGVFQDTRDSHSYTWIRIGTQIWMAENMAYLPSVSPSSDASDSIPYYYVYGNEGTSISAAAATNNFHNYGVLYNHAAAQTACPSGWHLPTKNEFSTLASYCGLFPGKMLKSTSEWREEGNGENTSSFNCRPSGAQYTGSNSYSDMGAFAFFWTATEDEYRFLSWNNYRIDSWSRFIFNSEHPLSFGFSVRCIQD